MAKTAAPRAASPEAPAVKTDKRSGAVVTVACKVALASLELQLCRSQIVQENTQTGPRDVTQWRKTGEIIVVRGTAYPRGTPPTGFPDKPEMIAGYAITRGIDAAFWDAWVEQNKSSAMVQSGMIFAYEDNADVKARAVENIKTLSGLEPVLPDKDLRIPRPVMSALSPLQTEDSRRKAAPAPMEADV